MKWLFWSELNPANEKHFLGGLIKGTMNMVGAGGPDEKLFKISKKYQSSFADPNLAKNQKKIDAAAMANKNGQSAAQLQMKQGLGQSINTQMALARSQPGVNTGLAARQAAQNISGAQQQVAEQTAILRAQEQAQQNEIAQRYLQMGLSLDQAQFQANQDLVRLKFGANQAAATAQTQQQGAIFGALGTAGAAMSDKTQKTEIKSKGGISKEFLDVLKPYEYKYKDPSMDGAAHGRRFGIMAQDLEKSEAGKSIVMDTPDGKKIDVSQGLGLSLAALADINERLKKLEK